VQPVETSFGRKTTIDQTTCNLDFSCLEGDCPAFMTIRAVEPNAATDAARGALPGPVDSLPEPVLVVAADRFAARIAGIGGTGVVTVSQVLGTAAGFDGFEVRGLDQIGLSQKAGPVVSDLHLRRGRPAETNRLGARQADLLLALDALVAASPSALSPADPGRTAVVGSTTGTPTGAMITQPGRELPPSEALGARIAAVTRDGHRYWADASAITTSLFGDALAANIFVMGMAVQSGCLPIRPASIERALELNGVGVKRNVAAFRWGRQQIADPHAVTSATAAVRAVAPAAAARRLSAELAARVAAVAGGDEELAATLRLLTADLVAYQNRRYASGFLDTIEQVAAQESAVVPGSTQLVHAVARSLYKLLAYKDEYEVARLMLKEEGLAPARRIARPGARISWRLHPPLLRALGLKRKLEIGSWTAPLFRVVAAARFLRGTPLDPFGRMRMRRIERELPDQYRAAIATLLAHLKPDRFDDAVAIANLPRDIRGYEGLKLARVNHYHQLLAEELSRFVR